MSSDSSKKSTADVFELFDKLCLYVQNMHTNEDTREAYPLIQLYQKNMLDEAPFKVVAFTPP